MSLTLLLCGIPGSGKSTIATCLKNCIIDVIKDIRLVSLFTFDDYEINKDQWNDLSFRYGRNQAIENYRLYLEQNNNNSIVNGFDSLAVSSNINNVAIIDDNMYLRSMRRDIYSLSRNHNVPVIIIWVQCDPSIAKERNKLRDTPVQDDSMKNIIESFESPQSSRIADRYYFVLNNNETVDSRTINNNIIEFLRINENKWKEIFLEFLQKRKKYTFNLLESNNIKPSEELELFLRKIVSEIIRELLPLQLSKDNLQLVIHQINQTKNSYRKSRNEISTDTRIDFIHECLLDLEDLSHCNTDIGYEIRSYLPGLVIFNEINR